MLWLVIYFLGWITCWPALLANMQSIGNKIFADKYWRGDIGTSMLMAFVPIFWIITPFITGFYEHGFLIGRRKK